MSWKVTLALLLLLALFSGGYLLTQPNSPEEPAEKPEASAPGLITDLAPPFVQLTLTMDGETVRAPVAGEAATPSALMDPVAALLRDLQTLPAIDEFPAGPDELAEFGLDPAQATLVLENASGDRLVIDFGHSNPPGTAIYLRFPERNRTVLAGAVLAWEFRQAFSALRRLAPPSPSVGPSSAAPITPAESPSRFGRIGVRNSSLNT